MSEYKIQYGSWAGNPKGRLPDLTRCAKEVWNGPRGMTSSQCSRPRGYGPDQAYCKQHAKSKEEKTQETVSESE